MGLARKGMDWAKMAEFKRKKKGLERFLHFWVNKKLTEPTKF